MLQTMNSFIIDGSASQSLRLLRSLYSFHASAILCLQFKLPNKRKFLCNYSLILICCVAMFELSHVQASAHVIHITVDVPILPYSWFFRGT